MYYSTVVQSMNISISEDKEIISTLTLLICYVILSNLHPKPNLFLTMVKSVNPINQISQKVTNFLNNYRNAIHPLSAINSHSDTR